MQWLSFAIALVLLLVVLLKNLFLGAIATEPTVNEDIVKGTVPIMVAASAPPFALPRSFYNSADTLTATH